MHVRFSIFRLLFHLVFWGILGCFSGQILAQDSLLRESATPSMEEFAEENLESIEPEPAVQKIKQRDAAQKIPLRETKTGAWAEAINSLDYSKDRAKATEIDDEELDLMPNFGFSKIFSGFLQGLLIFVGLVLIGFFVFKIVSGVRSKTVQPTDLFEINTIGDLENNLFESDLQKMRRQARESGQFGLAIRIQYLMIIRQLSEKNYLKWRREKTNRHYLNELSVTIFAADFRKITPIYEQIWYGEMPISEAEFLELEPVFDEFLARIHPK